ncbi:histidine kinase dimerization/phospho-acceptor domain-containing protein [Curtobacterium flaccumfaciens]|nr:histidine kinase dimerization/phospho-acceptor domain-containing protein [Curtobacterium flaccumfaciens]
MLVLACFGGATWLLSCAALRPVSRMRREAERLSAGEADADLPVGDARDELQALARTLNEFLSRTRDAAARERQMVSDASHELRTPLAILTTQLELASLDRGDAAALQVHVKQAQHNVARLARLMNDLLTLSRADEAERVDSTSRTLTSWEELSDEVLVAVDRLRMIAAAKTSRSNSTSIRKTDPTRKKMQRRNPTCSDWIAVE